MDEIKAQLSGDKDVQELFARWLDDPKKYVTERKILGRLAILELLLRRGG